jgi:Rrf2 family protein
MRISAKADYALRGLLEIAADPNPPVKRDAIAKAQRIPVKFLESILNELKHAEIITSQRGAEGGYALARPAGQITVADVMRVIEGPLASVRDVRPEDLEYKGVAVPLKDVFVALRAHMREVLEVVSLEDLVTGDLPAEVRDVNDQPESWESH